jgi:hypothetical protein
MYLRSLIVPIKPKASLWLSLHGGTYQMLSLSYASANEAPMMDSYALPCLRCPNDRGFGAAVAPILGGLLSEPYDEVSTFDTPFWRRYAYLLPCLISASIATIAALLGCHSLSFIYPLRHVV